MTPEPTPPVDPSLPEEPSTVIDRDRLGDWLQSKPVFGAIMLVIGLLVGYVGRPALEAQPTVTASAPVSSSSVSGVQGPVALPQSQEELLPYLISQTRHWRGSPDAPVTLIEFGDFQ